MRPTDRNFEGFMDVRDMLQRDDASRKMVQKMTDQPTRQRVVPRTPSSRPMPPQRPSGVPQRPSGVPARKNPEHLKDEFLKAILATKPNLFENAVKNEVAIQNDMLKSGLQQLAMAKQAHNRVTRNQQVPVINKSWGGFLDGLKDVAVGTVKNIGYDLGAAAVGSLVDATGLETLSDIANSAIGQGLIRTGLQGGLPILEEELFGTTVLGGSQHPDHWLYAGLEGLRYGEEHRRRHPDEPIAGALWLDEEDPEEREILRKMRDRQKEERAKPFYQQVAGRAGLGKTVSGGSKKDTREEIVRKLGTGVIPLLTTMEKHSQPEQPDTAPQKIPKSKNIAKLPDEVGGQRGVSRSPKYTGPPLTEKQQQELRTKGFTTVTDKSGKKIRITKQDLVGSEVYRTREKPVRATQSGGLVSLARSGPVHISQHPQYDKIGLTPAEKGSLGDPTFAYQNAQFHKLFPTAAVGPTQSATEGDAYLTPAIGGVRSSPYVFKKYREWLDSIGGAQNLDQRAVRKGILTKARHEDEYSDENTFDINQYLDDKTSGAYAARAGAFLNPFGLNWENEWRAMNRGRDPFGNDLGPMPSALEKIAPLLSSSSDISIGFDSGIPVSQAFRSLSGDSSGLATVLSKFGPSAANRNFVLKLLGADTEEDIDELLEENEELKSDLLEPLFTDLKLTPAATGGSVNLKRGGSPKQETIMKKHFSGLIGGEGHGMEDNVQMPIVSDGQQIATLAVSPDEYVFDAYTVSALGNGSAKEGGKILDQVVKDIRAAAYGTDDQPNEINGSEELKISLSGLA